jgi:hypothetical protein
VNYECSADFGLKYSSFSPNGYLLGGYFLLDFDRVTEFPLVGAPFTWNKEHDRLRALRNIAKIALSQRIMPIDVICQNAHIRSKNYVECSRSTDQSGLKRRKRIHDNVGYKRSSIFFSAQQNKPRPHLRHGYCFSSNFFNILPFFQDIFDSRKTFDQFIIRGINHNGQKLMNSEMNDMLSSVVEQAVRNG